MSQLVNILMSVSGQWTDLIVQNIRKYLYLILNNIDWCFTGAILPEDNRFLIQLFETILTFLPSKYVIITGKKPFLFENWTLFNVKYQMVKFRKKSKNLSSPIQFFAYVNSLLQWLSSFLEILPAEVLAKEPWELWL